MTNELSQMSQENILTLLAFDEKACPVLCSLDIKLFGSDIYRNIASACIDYYKTFKLPAGSHLPDLLEEYINQKDKSKADIYKSVLINLNETKDTINAEYVLKSLSEFIDTQSLKLAICKAFDLIQEQKIQDAKKVLIGLSKNADLHTFNPGIFFDKKEILKCSVIHERPDIIYTGIEELDCLEICPARKKQFLLLGPPKRGKTRGLVYLGKTACMQRKKVLHVTLEMQEEEICRLYTQAFFAISHKKAYVTQHLLFDKDDKGNFMNYSKVIPTDTLSLEDEGFLEKLENLIKVLKTCNLVIKEFPSGSLTIDKLIQYMDLLELRYNFIPDMVIIDYPGIMEYDTRYLREQLGKNIIDLRGLAMERNHASVIVMQAHRVGARIKLLTEENISEDFSAAMTVDNFLTINQTPEEYTLGLARLYVALARKSRKGDIIIISQNPSIGQFCISSAKMSNIYDTLLTSIQGVKE